MNITQEDHMATTLPRFVYATIFATAVALLTIGAAAQRPSSPGNSAQAPGRQGEPQGRAISAQQKANLHARMELARAIVDRHQPEAEARGLAIGWRQALLETLLPLSLQSLTNVQGADSMEALSAAVASESLEPQAFGSTTEDLVYKPIVPCRYIDTRNVGGKISGFRGYDLAFSGATYGGLAACNPTALFGVGQNSFGAIVMNMTIVHPLGAPGFAAIKPTQVAPTTSLINWYQSGPAVQVANQGILTMDQTAAANEFWIQTSDPVDVIIDIFGAFIAPNATPLDCVTTAATVQNVAAGGTFGITPPACPAGYAQVAIGCRSPSYNSANWAITGFYQPGTGGGSCWGSNITGSAQNYEAYARCCRIPGR
jgi:hypothetical protein